jgi:hypothetical protein
MKKEQVTVTLRLRPFARLITRRAAHGLVNRMSEGSLTMTWRRTLPTQLAPAEGMARRPLAFAPDQIDAR